MKIILYNKDEYNRKFIEDLPSIALKLFNNSFNRMRLSNIDNEFDIDSLNIIRFALKNLIISEQPNSYSISINKNLKYDHQPVDSLINVITYGNRNCRGYTIVLDIFNYIVKNIDILYKEWLDGS
jgi:hypothetical protein